MAIDFNVYRACKVQAQKQGDGAFVDVGYTTDGQAPEWTTDQHMYEAQAQDTGDEPGELIYTGRRGQLALVLVKVDLTNILKIVTAPGETVIGAAGTIGTRLIDQEGGSPTNFQIQLVPADSSKSQLLFQRCYLAGPGAFRLFDMGNMNTKYGLAINVMRDGSGNLFTEVPQT